MQRVVCRDAVKRNGQETVGGAALPLVEAEAVVAADADDASRELPQRVERPCHRAVRRKVGGLVQGDAIFHGEVAAPLVEGCVGELLAVGQYHQLRHHSGKFGGVGDAH